MHLMIFYPGGVSYGALPDDASNEEIYNVMQTAATIEEGNGNGKIKERTREEAPNAKTKKRAS